MELIADFMRIRLVNGATWLEVALVEWPHPHEPRLRWQQFHTWPGVPAAAKVETVQRLALADPRFFRRCKRCGELCNRGHMHNQNTCQSCAERVLGVIH